VIPFPAPFFSRGAIAAGPAFAQAVFSSSIVITNLLPVDDTVPLISEGAEILSLTVTPQSAASRFLVEAAVFAGPKIVQEGEQGEHLAQTVAWAAALFRGATCIQAHAVEGFVNDDPCGNLLRLALIDQPATAAPLTWSVRAGPGGLFADGSPSDPGMGLRVNGSYIVQEGFPTWNGRVFGGAAKCTLTVQELP
jgi:hypothetical protein